MEFISFRSKKELKDSANFLAKLENRNVSDEYREIFVTGIDFKRKQIALDKYSKGEVSLGKAAELACLSVWEFLEEMREKKISLNLSAEDVLDAVEAI